MPVPAVVVAMADLVWPRSCIGCARAGRVLCERCVPLDVLHVAAAGLPVVAAGAYDGPLRAALIAYKERGRRDLAEPLGTLLAGAVPAEPGVVLVPVPSTARVARARGGDHMLRLARIASRASHAPVGTPLRLVRTVQDSAGLDHQERAANLSAAMSATSPPSPGTAAVIVDDIVTTGATLREAARALAAAGWSVRAAAVVAATERKRPAR
ncbi:MAG: phosphoribosyltransferase family protein [Pseudonocardiales bacterium]